ncbi:pyrroline-5-carboxylate reductase [Baekduia soli]|uniref:Pyrroline-5-carboxylate reductase n=1 Tax=Baekduia soli TaxID=496014 RepID=A0A5B8U7P2_9ACTN|nr:pyrroline-5-carboxylate reductase [Baekduia soli]QEC49126.1 pyrroline-5-carboxylate reductase [Baekduia soli]
MQVGLVGSGNMARGLARGWRRSLLCTDPLADRAQALADEVGGTFVATNVELAQRADLVVLCHKPAQLDAVAAEVAPYARAVASILGGVPLEDLRVAYPGRPVYRFLPNTPVELRQGVVVRAADAEQDEALDAAVAGLFAELGTLVEVDDALVDVAMGLMSCAPAYVALLVEAQVDAGVRRGLTPDKASEMVVATFAGTAALLRARGNDTLAVRREVTSPGGSTARGLAALEHAGVRAAFDDALGAVLGAA